MISKVRPDAPDLIRVSNHHVGDSGRPPSITVQRGQAVSYFENHYGEQWVMVAAEDRKSASIFGGDVGWKHPVRMDGPGWFDKIDINLNTEEIYWILSCALTLETDMAVKDKLINLVRAQAHMRLFPLGSISKLSRMKESQISDKEALAKIKEFGLVFAPEDKADSDDVRPGEEVSRPGDDHHDGSPSQGETQAGSVPS